MYIYTPFCRNRITLYRYVTVLIVPHMDIELEDKNKNNCIIVKNCLQLPRRDFIQAVVKKVMLTLFTYVVNPYGVSGS